MKTPSLYEICKQPCGKVEKLFIGTTFLTLTVLAFKFFGFRDISAIGFGHFTVISAIFLILAYLAYFDLKKMEVHNSLSFVLLTSLLLLNVGIYILSGSEGYVQISETWKYIPYENFIAAIILGTLFLLTVLISKEKALGLGDVRIAIISGLLVSYGNLILWAYITVFSALIYGLLITRGKRMKGLTIPFVPFMVLGIFVVVLLGV